MFGLADGKRERTKAARLAIEPDRSKLRNRTDRKSAFPRAVRPSDYHIRCMNTFDYSLFALAA
jgi:5-methylcytosine-specific restriction endonuclease McrBC GTP-binding regulatory subunit McrB